MAAWPRPPCGSAPAGCRRDNPDVPDQVDVSADRKAVRAGRYRAHPYRAAVRRRGDAAGAVAIACIRCATCRCPPAAPMSTCRCPPTGGPAPMSTVHVFRTAADAKSRPAARSDWPGSASIPACASCRWRSTTPDKYPPRARAAIRLRTAPGAWVSLAAVDEGILRLTNFVSPDPSEHFLGRRRLGLDIRDDWGRLIAPPDGEATVLRQGGDEGSFALPDIPQKTVTLFVAAGAGGRRRRGGVPARSARLQRPGAADGGGLERQPHRRRRQPTSTCAIRWWRSRCCRASSRPATRRG